MQKEGPLQEKIAVIIKECEEAGATKWDILKIIKVLEQHHTENIEAMRDIALTQLEKLNPNAAAVYSSFRKMRVYTSAENIEPFDRGNIIKSLLRETDVSRSVAEKISNEVENQIKDLKIKKITTALIRTLVNVKLLEYAHEHTYEQYTRVGSPVFDVSKRLAEGRTPCDMLMREYCLLKVIPEKSAELHYQNKIYISKLEDFPLKGYAFSYLPQPQEKSAEEALLKIILTIKNMQQKFSLPININSLNFALSNLIATLSQTRIERFAEICVDSLNEFYGKSPEWQKPTVGLDLYEDIAFEKKCNKTAALEFALRFIESYKESERNFNIKLLVDSKYNLQLLTDDHIYDGLYFVNCKDTRYNAMNGAICIEADGILQLVGINMQLIANETRKEREFNSEILNICDGINILLEKKQEFIKNLNLPIQRNANCVAIYGLNEAVEIIGGGEKMKNKIYEMIKEKIASVEIIHFEDGGGIEKFEKANKKLNLKESSTTIYTVQAERLAIEKTIANGVKCFQIC